MDLLFSVLLLLRALAYFLILSSLFVAGAIWALRRRYHDASALVLGGLALVGVAGYTAFWVWFVSPRLGYFVSLIAPLACAGYAVWRTRGLSPRERSLLLQAAKPWVLAFCAALTVLAAGFSYGGSTQPLITAQSRFSHPLAADNELPLMLADQMEGGRIKHPMAGDWLSSDRPPLQTGITLLVRPFRAGPRTLAYMLNAVFLQCLWIPALWALLHSFRVRGRVLVWALAAALFSGFNLVNSFYVWPKLLSAAFVIAALVFMLAPDGEVSEPARAQSGLLCGIFIALSLLAHGGSIFLLLAIPITLLIIHKPLPLSRLPMVAAALLAFYLPWVAYQKIYDPPGDRLLKMHLAGVRDPDPRSLVQVCRDAYSHLTPGQVVGARLSNLNAAFDHQREYWQSLAALAVGLAHAIARQETSALSAASRQQRSLQFFHFVPTLGLFMAGPLLLLTGLAPSRRTPLWRTAGTCWLLAFCTLLFWCLLMFVPASAVIHQGSYAVVLIAFAGSFLSFWNLSPLLAKMTVAAQSTLTSLIYLLFRPGTVHLGELILLVLALALLGWTLRWVSIERESF